MTAKEAMAVTIRPPEAKGLALGHREEAEGAKEAAATMDLTAGAPGGRLEEKEAADWIHNKGGGLMAP